MPANKSKLYTAESSKSWKKTHTFKKGRRGRVAAITGKDFVRLFIAMSGRLTQQQRAKQAFRVALYAAIILLSVRNGNRTPIYSA
jgi:hypothetical protein